jgi:hypothetical protein
MTTLSAVQKMQQACLKKCHDGLARYKNWTAQDCADAIYMLNPADFVQSSPATLPAQDKDASAGGQSKPTDISDCLREYAGNSGYSHNDYADTMRAAADEIERYYGGMMAWKQTAETKDRQFRDEVTARVNERIAARNAAPAGGQDKQDAIDAAMQAQNKGQA